MQTIPTKPLRSPGDFQLVSCSIKSLITQKEIDVQAAVTSINIFERVDQPLISGYMEVTDWMSIASGLPFSGNEVMTMELRTGDDMPLKGSYFIYKISERNEFTPKLMKYLIHFVSIESLLDLNTVVGKRLEGKPHELAKEILEYLGKGELTKAFTFEEAVNTTQFIPAFWHPLKCIDYLCEHSLNEDGNGDFTFFENRVGFNFLTYDMLIRNLAENDNKADYSFIRTDDIPFETTDDLEKNYQKILALVIPESNDYIKNITSGMYGSLMFAYDHSSLNLCVNIYDARNQYKNNYHLNPYPLTPPNFMFEPGGCILDKNYSTNTFEGQEDISNTTWIQHRISRIGLIKNHILSISVYGRTGYTVGRTANVNLFEQTLSEKKDDEAVKKAKDYLYSGNYIVAGIRHSFDTLEKQYKCDIELWKDSTIVDISLGENNK